MKIEQKTVYDFQSDVKDLLHLMIHSLYSNKEIFLRELISNASDAIDKLRFLSISKPELYENNTNLNIRIFSNKENNTLTIRDTGIGMNHQDTIDNLGTIAKSGTKKFVQELQKKEIKNSQLIGQFGVGFYSAFIVSYKVSVRTRLAGTDIHKGVLWESSGQGNYTISNIIKKERGTEITLFLKKEEQDFLEHWKIKKIVTKYANHITVPVEIKNTENNNNKWEKINTAQALWCLQKHEITHDQYNNFYKNITNDINEPLLWSHNHVEGKLDYTSLIYIPKKSSWDLWNKDNKHGLKLYIKRVYIMDDAEQFLPNYLRFVRGLIDSNDLPLNISREILQDNPLIKKLRTALTKRVLKLLENLANTKKEQYHEFWKEFGLILKEGPAEDNTNKNIILNLLRFTSINTGTLEQTLSLNDYVSNMSTQQEKIYFITADSYSAANNSPHLEIFKKKGIDVLLLSDKIDEWMMNYVTEFNGKKFQSVSKNDDSINKILDINNIQEKKIKTEMQSFINHAKKILGDQIKDIIITNTLINSPVVLVTDSNDMTTQMSKLFIAAGQQAPKIKYILKINPEHNLIKKIISMTDDKETTEWIKFLMEQALFIEQGNLNNPNSFINRINKLLLRNYI